MLPNPSGAHTAGRAGSRDRITASAAPCGGLTTKTHLLVDGRGRPLVVVCTPGQAGDSPALPVLLAGLRVPRLGRGRPHTTPSALLGDNRCCEHEF